MLCAVCKNAHCLKCERFETAIFDNTHICKLKEIRLHLFRHSTPPPMTFSEKFAVSLVTVAFSMKFFIACNVLAFTPVAAYILHLPEDTINNIMKIVNFISSNWWQLAYLPLIGMAGLRTQKVGDFRAEREYKIQLINDRIEELRDAGGDK